MGVLHVLNGDTVREPLERSGVAGELAVYADILHEGPVPPGFDADAAAVRARFIADAGYGDYDFALETGLHWQAALDRHADYDDVVLWYEHDLFDQLLLIRQLAFFDSVQRTNGLWLINTDRYLGNQSAEQLAHMYDEARAPVSAAQRELGARAWAAFTSAAATELQRIANHDTRALPFLHGGLVRMLEEYPSTSNGLGRLDRQILELLAAHERTPDGLFTENAKLEERIFLGDYVFWKHVEALTRGPAPLLVFGVTASFEERLPEGVVSITDAGRDVVNGRADAIALNGIDRWIGGVHLTGSSTPRWDAAARQIVGPA